MNKSFHSSIIKNLLNHFEGQGIDIDSILSKSEINLEDVEQTIPSNKFGCFIEQVCTKVNDNRIGLKLGFQSPLSTLGIMGQIYQSCETFEQVLSKMKKYIEVLDNLNTYTYQIQGNKIIHQTIGDDNFRKIYPVAERQIIEHNIGFSIRCKREYLGREIKPIEIWSPYQKDGNTDILENYFECKVLFGRPYMAIILPIEMLKWKVPTASPDALFLYENYCKALIMQKTSWSLKVKNCIWAQFQINVPTLSLVAKQLSVSERTLQRYLKEDENSFQSILDQMRLEMATFYLKQSNITVVEISYRLGFDVVNSFNRFFKAKTGTNPLTFRLNYRN
jgi:AraC-like DNA-binding protein